MVGMHAGTELVAAGLLTAGVRGQVRILDGAARTAAQAAEQLSVPVGAIANSLIFAADGEPLLVLTSGAHRVDTAALAGRLGFSEITRADPDFVRTHTGQPIGGVAPIGHPHPLRTLVDESLGRYPIVWAAAGHPHSVFPTTFDELVRITGGTPVRVNGDD
jgi:prolyl-tRNA editing enzyme YbaK/EbsC (Cys-tRNA(Pro) deacylase)